MATVKKNIIEGNFIRERNGEIVEAGETVWVFNQTGSVLTGALAQRDVPQPAESLNDDEPDVRVVERTGTVAESTSGSGAHIRIHVRYERQRPETETDFAIRGGASLTQKKTFVDRDDNAIELTYDGDTVRAAVNVHEPQGHFTRELRIETNNPDTIVQDWIGHVNSQEFRGYSAGEWLCTNVEYELVDKTPRRIKAYDFRFEFERRPGGWTYTVAFEDENGDIPDDVVDGTGIKDINWHPERDFTTRFT